jgi:hypothetical protein
MIIIFVILHINISLNKKLFFRRSKLQFGTCTVQNFSIYIRARGSNNHFVVVVIVVVVVVVVVVVGKCTWKMFGDYYYPGFGPSFTLPHLYGGGGGGGKAIT